MRPQNTSELAAFCVREQTTLAEIQESAIYSQLEFPVKSTAINHLMALKAHGEEKYLASLQRKEIAQNKVKMQKQRLENLHQTYAKFQELYKSYQATIKKSK
jgi:hypothetical protein